METLDTPILTSPITTIAVTEIKFTDTAAVLSVAASTDTEVYHSFVLTVSNGECNGIRATLKPDPDAATDIIEMFTVNIADGYDQVFTAFSGKSGALLGRIEAVETIMISMGLFPDGNVA